MGEPTSWQYDPFSSMSTTIGNQFEILMLIEMLELRKIHCLSANTDGIVCLIDKSQFETYKEVCLEWEVIVGNNVMGKLEYTYYDLFVQRSVNSYLAVKTNDLEYIESLEKRIKTKNDFLLDIEIHKNKSNLIINKALKEYFVHDIDPKVFIKEHRNIYDFCACVRGKGDWGLEQEGMVAGVVVTNKLQKTVRYYESKDGMKILKRHPDGRQIEAEAGKWMQTVFNKFVNKPWNDYNIDYDYYIEKVYDIINIIKPEVSLTSTQMSLNFAA